MSHWAPAFAGVTGFSWIHDLSFDHCIESVSIQKSTSITTIRDHARAQSGIEKAVGLCETSYPNLWPSLSSAYDAVCV